MPRQWAPTVCAACASCRCEEGMPCLTTYWFALVADQVRCLKAHVRLPHDVALHPHCVDVWRRSGTPT